MDSGMLTRTPKMLTQTSGLLHTQCWSLYFPSLAWFSPGTLSPLPLLLSSCFLLVFHRLNEVAIWWAGHSPAPPPQKVPRGRYQTSLCYSG